MSQKYVIQLYEGFAGFPRGPIIKTATGGKCLVITNGDTSKATVTDSAGASLTNAVVMTNGGCTFYTANSVTLVDLYIQAPDGQFVTKLSVAPGATDISIDVNQRDQVMVIPFSMTDMTAATEYTTGFTEPANSIFLPTPSIRVTTLDATETLDVGTDSTDSGDANGFLAAISVNAAAVVLGDLTAGTDTMGALLFVLDSANSGDDAPQSHIGAAKSITMELTTGSDTAEGFVYLPYRLIN